MKKVSKAVILAAGRGTRFLPYTKACPKEMLPVVDTPSLQLIVQEVVDAGINDVLIIISPDKKMIEKHFSVDKEFENFLIFNGKHKDAKVLNDIGKMANVTFAYQQVANGSGNAVMLAKEFLNGEAGAVLNGDDLVYSQNSVTKQLADVYQKYGKTVIGVQKVEPKAISKYGSIQIDQRPDEKTFFINRIVEKPPVIEAPSFYAALGRYIISPDFFDYLQKTPVSKNGELQFTDALNLQAMQTGICAYDFEGVRYDLGDKLGYLKAIVEYGLRDQNLGNDFAEYLKNVKI
ncbi:MAG: UTP--glucose-1-phosphate uridylyltransferase [Clostridia bacterium]|nr:UTP--glucose-1-phosphate uridylyltransferase [Clostridia bacterium]MBR2302600.1 UTP--glucose-1-phosphate uridylyltransferase [Clostridia bacterium]